MCPGRKVVHVEAEHRQVARFRNPGRDQRADLIIREIVVAREGEPVGQVDPEVVGREGEQAGVHDRPERVVDRLFRLERDAAPQRRDRGGGGNRAVVNQVAELEVELGRHVQHVLRRPSDR